MTESLHQVAIGVNTARSDYGATICRMEPIEKRQGKRLKQARIEAGFEKSAMQAADACGWKYSTYAAHERGSRPLKFKEAVKYTRRFSILGSTITAKSVLFPDDKAEAAPLEPDEAEVVYQRGWRDAIAHITGLAQREQAPVPGTPKSKRRRAKP